MQLVQQGNVNKLLTPVVMATPGKAMSVLEKIERLRNNNSSNDNRDGFGFARRGSCADSVPAATRGHGHHLEASPGPVPGRGWAEVGDLVQQARNRSHRQGPGKVFPPVAP